MAMKLCGRGTGQRSATSARASRGPASAARVAAASASGPAASRATGSSGSSGAATVSSTTSSPTTTPPRSRPSWEYLAKRMHRLYRIFSMESIAPAEPLTRTEWIDRQLRAAILTNELAPGEKLVTTALAERWQVSPTPLRESLKRLAAEGLVELTPHGSARV